MAISKEFLVEKKVSFISMLISLEPLEISELAAKCQYESNFIFLNLLINLNKFKFLDKSYL